MQYAKRNILIVEDNIQDYIIFNEVLGQIRDFFIHLDHAGNMAEALELCETKTYDIVFLDLFLPDSFGQESFSTLQAAMSHTPIVILSGLSDKNIVLDIVKLGAQDYLVKGEFDSNLLEKSIIYSIERRRYQERLAMNERKYRSTFRNIGVSIVEANVTGIARYFQQQRDEGVERFVTVLHSDDSLTKLAEELEFTDLNPEALSLFGYSSVERFVEGFVRNREQVIQQFTPMFKAMWGGAHYYEGETLFKDANNLPIYALMKVKFLQESGEHRMLISIADITVLKEKEQEVLRQSAILQGISDSAITLLNVEDEASAMEKTLRLLTQSLEGEMAAALEMDESEAGRFSFTLKSVWQAEGVQVDRACFTGQVTTWMDEESIARLREGDPVQVDGVELCTSEGADLPERSFIFAPLLLGGNLSGTVAVCLGESRDFNDYELSSLQSIAGNIGASLARHNAQNELRQLNENLEDMVDDRTQKMEAAIRELESFSYSVSHDLRAPLRAITGFSQVLEQEIGGKLSEVEEKYLGHIVRGADEMSQLIDDLLDFSRMGRKELKFSVLNMTDLANEQITKLSRDVKRELNFEVGTLHPCMGDLSMIRQVMQNLIGNAIKYSKADGANHITLTSSEHEELVEYCVSDTGVGFDMRYVDKIFGVFQRLHQDSEFDGTGVGLAIVQRVVVRHGGTVRAEGEVDQGAKFYFTLPKADSQPEEHLVTSSVSGVNQL
ncbi:MAG: ATP-binding protein [Flavobacteriales bacterium]